MKHTWMITTLLVLGFVLSQLIGIGIISRHVLKVDGVVEWRSADTFLGPVAVEWTGFPALGFILLLFIIGLPIMLLLMHLGWVRLWKIWYGFAVLISLNVAFSTFMQQSVAFVLALVMTLLKIFRPSVITHNVSELFVYGGLAAIFVPMLTPVSAMFLLIVLSVYDFYAVIRSKFMMKMAKFQSRAGSFAGLIMTYSVPKKVKKRVKKEMRIAVLGGGDLTFPLLFTGTIVASMGSLQAMIIVLFTALSLLLLFIYGKKGKFYPALPFVTAGCIIGWSILRLVWGTW